MALEEECAHESSRECYGKRGISVHGNFIMFVIYTGKSHNLELDGVIHSEAQARKIELY